MQISALALRAFLNGLSVGGLYLLVAGEPFGRFGLVPFFFFDSPRFDRYWSIGLRRCVDDSLLDKICAFFSDCILSQTSGASVFCDCRRFFLTEKAIYLIPIITLQMFIRTYVIGRE